MRLSYCFTGLPKVHEHTRAKRFFSYSPADSKTPNRVTARVPARNSTRKLRIQKDRMGCGPHPPADVRTRRVRNGTSIN
eukprot:scaffold25920_cov49-Prasinocladus_malaysianus.AAC.1